MKKYAGLFLMFIAIGCGHKYACPNEPLVPEFVGYSTTEIDSFLIRRFTGGGNFSVRKDSILITRLNAVFSRQSDTVRVLINDRTREVSDKDYDYQIVNLFDGKTVSLSDLQYESKTQRSGGLFSMDPQPCFSPLISYKRDGTDVKPTSGFNSLYIKK